MKSAIAVLVAGAALATATVTKTDWVYEVVTVTVTADPTDFVQNSKPTSTPTPEPAPVTSAAPAPPPPAANAAAEQPKSEAPPPPPPPATTSTPEPVVVVSTPEPAPQPTQTQQPAAQPETLSPDGSYQQTAVDYHNAYRRDHSAGALVWDETLAQYAANTANGCVFEHDMNQGDGKYGQNLASFGASGDLGTLSNAVGDAIAKQWYDEVKNYNFYGQSDPPPGVDFNDIGHYTQMVWKSTQKVGCCTVKCPAGSVLGLPSLYTVCNYSPPGNFQGQYASNVLPSLGLKISLST